MRRALSLAALLGLAALALPPARGQERGAVKLFNGKDLTGWKVFIEPKSAGKAKPEDVWSVKDGVLACKGRPIGYVATEEEYSNYILELEWRWPGKGGNSGVLCHKTGPDKIWPKSWEAQLASGGAGDIWLIDYKLDVDKARQDPRIGRHYFREKTGRPVEKKLGEWNKYRITCKGDTVKLEINGQVVNEGTAAENTSGKIVLQSEGTPVEFRNITLTPIR